MNALVLNSVSIRQTDDGLFCLNDLHKAAGGKRFQQPSEFIRLESTKQYVDLLKKKSDTPNSRIEENQVLRIIKGGGGEQGTFVTKRLVFEYAAWISPEFKDHVWDVFENYIDAKTQKKLPRIPTTTNSKYGLSVDQCNAINAYIHDIATSYPESEFRKHFDKCYGVLSRKFKVKSYKDIKQDQFADAMALLSRTCQNHSLEDNKKKYLRLTEEDLDLWLAQCDKMSKLLLSLTRHVEDSDYDDKLKYIVFDIFRRRSRLFGIMQKILDDQG